jgi:hypothetical protein
MGNHGFLSVQQNWQRQWTFSGEIPNELFFEVGDGGVTGPLCMCFGGLATRTEVPCGEVDEFHLAGSRRAGC